MKPLNPHELVGNQRDVWWNDLTKGKPITLELIDYFKGVVTKKGLGWYVVYYALAKEDYEPLGILKGDEFMMYFAYKSFISTLRKLKSELKVPCTKDKADGKNLLLKYERLNKTTCKIHHQEIREPTEEQLKEAKKQYKFLLDEERYYKEKLHRLENE